MGERCTAEAMGAHCELAVGHEGPHMGSNESATQHVAWFDPKVPESMEAIVAGDDVIASAPGVRWRQKP